MNGILIVGDQGHPRALEIARELRGDIVENPSAIDDPVGFIARASSGVVTDVVLSPDANEMTAADVAHVCWDHGIALHRVR